MPYLETEEVHTSFSFFKIASPHHSLNISSSHSICTNLQVRFSIQIIILVTFSYSHITPILHPSQSYQLKLLSKVVHLFKVLVMYFLGLILFFYTSLVSLVYLA